MTLSAINNQKLSIVIPVYNEESSLRALFTRLTATLDRLDNPYEIIFTNDGSRDDSLAILRTLHTERPHHVRVIDFNANYGQHMAIMAAFENVRGDIIITMDADLQNPPEEIPALLAQIAAGHDVVGSYRADRNDHVMRRWGSKVINVIRAMLTNIRMRDQGCMLRAYRRRIIEHIVQSKEPTTFIPALAYKLAANPTEIEVRHEARTLGTSKYSIYKLIRVTLDLLTGFSLVPLHVFSIGGMIIAFFSMLLCGYLLLRRIFLGPEAEGLFTLFAIQYFLMGVCITGVGIVGEYVGRTNQVVTKRPRFIIREIIEDK